VGEATSVTIHRGELELLTPDNKQKANVSVTSTRSKNLSSFTNLYAKQDNVTKSHIALPVSSITDKHHNNYFFGH